MPLDAELNLLTDATLDEATDGTHAHVEVQDTATVDALVSIGFSAAPAAVDDTLDVNIEVSRDGGATYVVATTFRRILGDEIADTLAEMATVRGFKAARRLRLPRAADGQGGILRVRAVTDAIMTAAGDFNVSIDLVDPSNVRDLWYDNAA